MTADIEDNYNIAQATEPLNEDSSFKNTLVSALTRQRYDGAENVHFMDVSPNSWYPLQPL